MHNPQKRCGTCGLTQPIAEFNKRAKASDGLQSRCRSCSAAWYEANKAAHKQNVRARNQRVRAEQRLRLSQYLESHPCVDCGEDDLRVLDFDHENPQDKLDEVVTLAAAGIAWERVEAEIAKCRVRCANCHRRRTADMFGYWRAGVERRRAEERHALATGRLQVLLGGPSG